MTSTSGSQLFPLFSDHHLETDFVPCHVHVFSVSPYHITASDTSGIQCSFSLPSIAHLFLNTVASKTCGFPAGIISDFFFPFYVQQSCQTVVMEGFKTFLIDFCDTPYFCTVQKDSSYD